MSQVITAYFGNSLKQLFLPDPCAEVLPGLTWGDHYEVFSPAFWAVQSWLNQDSPHRANYKLGNNLREEIVACLLGGYGIPAEIGLIAFHTLKSKGIFDDQIPTEKHILSILQEPLILNSKLVRYRFARQKAHYISQALSVISKSEPPNTCGKDHRDWLVNNIPGVGIKTASWITRNILDCNDVAIIDIHIHRSGIISGYFEQNTSPQRDYYKLERQFIEFSNAINVPPSILDNLIWRTMKDLGRISLRAFKSM